MIVEEMLKILPQSVFIIFISTFAGALAGEFNRETTNGKPCSFPKFMSRLLSSWITAFASILFIHSTFDIENCEVLISISIIFGFVGYKYSIDFMKKIISSKFKNDE